MIIAGTGHRPQKLKDGFSDETFNKLVSIIKIKLIKLQPEKVISGMALGFDTCLAQAAIDLGIYLIAAVPFDGQESIWPQNSKEKYYELLIQANETVVVSTGGYAAWKLHKRNQWMIDNCDKILALWNGDKSGGTYQCLQYAKDKEVINLWESFNT
jgi:uncharacterized phage-like protein YoqJ